MGDGRSGSGHFLEILDILFIGRKSTFAPRAGRQNGNSVKFTHFSRFFGRRRAEKTGEGRIKSDRSDGMGSPFHAGAVNAKARRRQGAKGKNFFFASWRLRAFALKTNPCNLVNRMRSKSSLSWLHYGTTAEKTKTYRRLFGTIFWEISNNAENIDRQPFATSRTRKKYQKLKIKGNYALTASILA